MGEKRREPVRARTGSLSRRRMIQGTAAGLAGLAAAGLIGCNNDGRTSTPSGGTTETAQPKRGGTIFHAGGPAGSFDTRDTLDPHTVDTLGARGYHLVYQGIVGYHPRTFAVEPYLAERWEQPDQLTYTFRLNSGVKWHNKPPANGREMTTQDVIFSLNRVASNDPRFISRSLLAKVDRVEAPDRSTITIRMKEADASFLTKLAGDSIVMMAPEVVERAGDRFATAEVTVGTGPFMMKAVEQGNRAEYVRNPDYWKPGRPYLDGFVNVHLQDDQAAYAAFLANQIQVMTLPGGEVKNYISRQGPGYTPDWYKEDSMPVMFPNLTVRPFTDPRIVRAVRLLTDHEEFRTSWCETWFGREGRHGSLFPNALSDWDLPEEEYSRHLIWRQQKDEAVREANSLLSAAGFSRDNPLRFSIQGLATPFLKAAAELHHAQLRRNSQGVIEPTLQIDETAVAFTKRARREFEYFVGGWSAVMTFEPDSWLSSMYRTGGSQNYPGFSDSQLDSMIDRQVRIFNNQERKTAVVDIVRYAMDKIPSVPPANRYFLNGVSPKVRDFAPYFRLSARQYEWVWLDA